MHTLWIAFAGVALAELGDKTQLLSLVLAARYRKPLPIVLGILVATLFNHALAALAGAWLGARAGQSAYRAGIDRKDPEIAKVRKAAQLRIAHHQREGTLRLAFVMHEIRNQSVPPGVVIGDRNVAAARRMLRRTREPEACEIGTHQTTRVPREDAIESLEAPGGLPAAHESSASAASRPEITTIGTPEPGRVPLPANTTLRRCGWRIAGRNGPI